MLCLHTRRALAVPFVLAAAFSAEAPAQTSIRTHDAPAVAGAPRFLVPLGDVVGDATPDYAVVGTTPASASLPTGMAVFDGSDGSRAWFVPHGAGYTAPGDAVRVGDRDGDGADDLLVLARRFPDVAQILSGRTGALLDQVTAPTAALTTSALDLGDTDGDGWDDLLFTARLAGVHVVSGAPGHAVLHAHVDPTLQYYFGGVLGDVDGDGVRDYCFSVLPGVTTRTVVHSGASGALLYSLSEFLNDPQNIGDVDGDGRDDFAASESGPSIQGGLHRVVVARSGVDGAPLWQFVGADVTSHAGGYSLSGGGDVDGDGFADVVGLEPGPNAPNELLGVAARVFSGRTGGAVQDLRVEDFADVNGCVPRMLEAIEVMGDLDGDGLADLGLVASTFDACGTIWALGEHGRVYLFRGEAGAMESFCPAPVNSTGIAARLRALGAPRVGSDAVGFQLNEGPTGEYAQLFFGPEAGPSGTPVAVGSGLLCIDGSGLSRVGAPDRIDAWSTADFGVDWSATEPAASWIAGSTWVVQAGYRDRADPAGANTTQALRLTFR